MSLNKQPEDAQKQVAGAIFDLEEIKVELDAVQSISHAKGYISALRYAQLLTHEEFKPLDEALDNALVQWHWKNPKPLS